MAELKPFWIKDEQYILTVYAIGQQAEIDAWNRGEK